MKYYPWEILRMQEQPNRSLTCYKLAARRQVICFMPRCLKASIKDKFSQAKSKLPPKILTLTSGNQLMFKGHASQRKCNWDGKTSTDPWRLGPDVSFATMKMCVCTGKAISQLLSWQGCRGLVCITQVQMDKHPLPASWDLQLWWPDAQHLYKRTATCNIEINVAAWPASRSKSPLATVLSKMLQHLEL